MSDLLVVRQIDDAAARPLLDSWAATREWVRSVELRDAWDTQELEINRRNAVFYKRGKHRDDLAALVLLLQEHGGRVVHLSLHRRPAETVEVDLGEWASHQAQRNT